jgi:hypothetical protein
MKIKVFDYNSELDCFFVRKEFKSLMERLYLDEWTHVVWLGRLFCMDNDFGEHWFDNWDEREEILSKTRENIEETELMVVVPSRFTDHGSYCVACRKRVERAICPDCKSEIHVGPDGPCNSDEVKKRFWTDVLDSLSLDLDTVFAKARDNCQQHPVLPIEQVIEEVADEYGYGKT